MKSRYRLIIACLGSFLCMQLNAVELDKSNSILSYISVKKNAIAEVGYFKDFTLLIKDTGDFTLTIDLSSIDSGIEVRDHRLRTFLFEVIRFPVARVTARLDAAFYKDLKAGQYVHKKLNALLSLHGMQKEISVAIKIIALNEGRLNISSTQPVLLKAENFKLTKGIAKLAELAKLNAINTVIPVSFSFSLKR